MTPPKAAHLQWFIIKKIVHAKKLVFLQKICTMKKLYITALLTLLLPRVWGQTVCHVHIDSDFESRCLLPQEGTSYIDQSPGQHIACKGSTVTYSAVGDCPCDTVYPYEWHIQGGTVTDSSNNTITVSWGNGATGIVGLTYDDGCQCNCNISVEIDLIEPPHAYSHTIPAYSVNDSGIKLIYVCRGGSISFTDSSCANGSETKGHWRQGAHGSSPALIYTLEDIMDNTEMIHRVKNSCGCVDEEIYMIEVIDGEDLKLSCYGTVCDGDVVTYEALEPPCDIYSWHAKGGQIVSRNGDPHVTVAWDSAVDGYGELALDGSRCSGNVCQTMLSRKIPVVRNNMPIEGRTSVCIGIAPGLSIDWIWRNDRFLYNEQTSGSTVSLPVDNFATYTLGVNHGDGCQVESSDLTIEESPECKCRGLRMEYEYKWYIWNCTDIFNVTITFCNNSENDFCFDSIGWLFCHALHTRVRGVRLANDNRTE